MQKIYFYGVRYCDIVLYLARTLKNMNYSVLVCDRSMNKVMRGFVPVFDEFDLDREIFDYAGFGYTYSIPDIERSPKEMAKKLNDDIYGISEVAESYEDIPGVTYVPKHLRDALKKAAWEDEEDSVFDIMIILCDASAAYSDYWNIDEDDGKNSVRLFITDEYPQNVYEMRSALKTLNKYSSVDNRELPGKKIFVVRDYTGTAKVIINDLEKLAGASKSFLIPWSKKDRKLEMLAAYNDGFRFLGASEKLRSLIEELCLSVGIDTAGFDYHRAYTNAGKGKIV